jgi:glycosyltransferase involved in cell wall biosynthesis
MVRSKLVIAGSNFIFNHIQENYQKFLRTNSKLLVIFRGINLDYFNKQNISTNKKEILIKGWKLDINKFIFLMPGRLTSWKGQEVFIEALNILIEDYNKTKFEAVILGSDQGRTVYTKKLVNLVQRYNLNNKIKFISRCKDMPLAYSVSNAVISASIEPEAFGRVAVEAQAMHKPIIASELGGSKETIINEKSGFLYKFDDPRDLAKYLNSVMDLDDDALYLIGNEGRKNVTKKFDVEKMCQTTFTEYKKLLNI